MGAYDKWEIAGVLPGDYHEYGDWVIQKNSAILDNIGGGIVYHKHVDTADRKILMLIDKEGSCRACGMSCPKGIIFIARTAKLDEV